LKKISNKIDLIWKKILQQHSYNYIKNKKNFKIEKTNIMQKKNIKKEKKKEKSYLNLIASEAKKRKEKKNS